MPTPSQQKSSLRKQALAKRDAIAEIQRIEMSINACEIAQEHIGFDTGTVIAGFYPIRSEIDLFPLMFSQRKSGARICLPVVTDKTTIEFRELVQDAPLVEGSFGTVGPDESAKVLDPQILLVPLSVFDRSGGRIGYGGGFYDRAIERLVAKGITPHLIGMAFSIQEVQFVPMEPHDRYLDSIITETEFIPATSQKSVLGQKTTL